MRQREVQWRGIARKLRRVGPPTGFAAMGSFGQYLRVSPRDRLVVVCVHRVRAGTPLADAQRDFVDFLPLADALVAGSGPAPTDGPAPSPLPSPPPSRGRGSGT